ncbi:hypothetical protein KP509_28G018000 [Ceratopteris richardii]|uniref:WRKY domain-containing protein n=1 Tax=Ceratopteris richardii TaxID=49495 RepID=A0A8T2RC94_CERRI|nr:hypothetical protein KP509_28G018000 [Ceratopteris richardii]
MDPSQQYLDDNLYSEGFEIPSQYSCFDEIRDDNSVDELLLNNTFTLLTDEGSNAYLPEEYKGSTTCGEVDAEEHLLARIEKSISSPTADQSGIQTSRFHLSCPGDELHVNNALSFVPYPAHIQCSRLPTITPTTPQGSVKPTNNDLDTCMKSDNLANFPLMQTFTDRNGDIIPSCNNLSSTNGSIGSGRLSYEPDVSLSSPELTVNSIINCLPTRKQERPSASQQSPDPPRTPRNFKVQEGVDQVLFIVPNTTPSLKDGYQWRKYGRKQISDATNSRSYFRCAVHGCPVRKWTQSYQGFVRFYYKGRHNHPPPPIWWKLSQVIKFHQVL